MKLQLSGFSVGEFPVARLTGVLMLVVLSMVFAAFGWYLCQKTEAEVAHARDEVKAHNLLQPLILSLNEEQKKLKTMYHKTPSIPVPATLSDLVRSLDTLAARVSLTDVKLQPKAESVLSKSYVEVYFSAVGSSEAIRRFLLELGDQGWVREIESVRLQSEQGAVRLSMKVNATYRSLG